MQVGLCIIGAFLNMECISNVDDLLVTGSNEKHITQFKSGT